MKKYLIVVLFVFLTVALASAKTTVCASLPDLASIASYIGGDRVDVMSIARSTADPHSVEVLPAYMVKVSRADLYLKIGLSLDQWADQIVDGARNSNLKIIDCSKNIPVLEKPTGKVDASMGDVHPEGNPHYWLDPDNGVIIAQTIADALTAFDAEGAAVYAANLERFKTEAAQKSADWKTALNGLANKSIVTYHSSWVYFANAFGLTIAAKIEPVPGIPPTATHLAFLVKTIQDLHINTVIQEPYFSDDGATYLARQTGVHVVKLAPSCDDVSAGAYLSHFQNIVNQLVAVQP
jgi:zinc/manganese transport system substrate-binding protein